MNTPRLLIGLVALLSASVSQAQFFSVSLEQVNYQTGVATTAVQHYSIFASVEDYPTVTGGTVSATSGVLTTPGTMIRESADLTEYEAHLSNFSTFTSNYPLNANYTLTPTGSPTTAVTVNGPGNTFAYYNPNTTLFTISGITGVWVGNDFRFDPTGVSSFTVTMNNYVTANLGGNYGVHAFVGADGIRNNRVGEISNAPVADATPYSAPTFLFTAGLAADGGDSDPSTFGFTAGSRLWVEGGLFNILGLADSGVGDGSQKAFVIGNSTAFTLTAIPEPSTYAAIAGALALTGVIIQRRRRA